MASFELDNNQSAYQIVAYKPGHLKINETVYTKSVIVSPSMIMPDWSPQNIDELTQDTLNGIKALKPDVLLIGTGSKFVILPIEIYGELLNAGIGVEVMDTSAACRTFNALSSENRNVVAALVIQ